MDTTLIPDDHPISVTPNNLTTEKHAVRKELDRRCDRRARPCHLDLAGDLDLLENSWVGEHAEARRLSGFDCTITGHHRPPTPEVTTFTVTVSGEERHYGEPGSTYLVQARDLHGAKSLVTEHFIATFASDVDTATGERCDPDVIVVEGPRDTFDGAPTWPADRPGRARTDVRCEPGLLGRAFRTWSAQ